MRIWISIFALISGTVVQAQIETFRPTPTHLKLLQLAERENLPFLYNDDIEQVVQDFARNYKGSSSILLGRYQYYDSVLGSNCESMGLPHWLMFIPLANTGYDARFIDSLGAYGMWPLPFNIGKKYELKETSLFDERFDPALSTVAALKYASALHSIYQDWRLAILAFRWGPIYVNQILHRANEWQDFETIFELLEPEARQTIVYFYACVAAFHRTGDGINTIDQIGPSLQPIPFKPATGKVVSSLPCPVSFEQLHSFYGLEWDDFQELNLPLKSSIVPYAGSSYPLILPVSIADSFENQRDSFLRWIQMVEKVNETDSTSETSESIQPSIGPEYVWIYYKIKSGDNVYTLADVFDCSTNQLRAWNRISGNNIIAGKTLKFHVPSSRKSYYNSINAMTHAQKKSLANKD